MLLLLLLVPIELLSYFIRPFTLSIRLFANMLAGHTMLAIFGGFAASVGVLALLPAGDQRRARRASNCSSRCCRPMSSRS